MSIQVEHIEKRFNQFAALHDINITFPSGELVALLGPSGCGKTTLLRIIAGLEHQTSGHIRFHGTDVSRLHARDRKVGFVFQHYALFRHMTVFDNIAFGLTVLPRRERPDTATIKAKVTKLLEMVQLAHLADRFPAQLSGGQKQRVALARALAVEPQILLLDEPFGALDAQVRKELRRWLRQLHEELQFTSVFVTHDQEEAMAISDRIAVMKDGVIQHVGTPRDIYQRPKNVFVATFIGRTNIVNAHVKDGIITFADGYHEHIDALDKAAEQDVRCSIRPEEFIICKDGTDGIHGTVQECTYLGLNTHYTIDTDQGDSVEIVEESSIGEGLKKGEKVLLKVKKEKINVFTKDGDTNLIRSDAYEKQ